MPLFLHDHEGNAMDSSAADPAFEALADPTRRAILIFLARRPESAAGAIAAEVGRVGRTAVSSHLRVLRAAGLVTERRDGRFRRYSVQSGAADGVVHFLAALYRQPLAELQRRIEGRTNAGRKPQRRRGQGGH